MTLVSIITTTYNREKYIAQSIESVLSSTFKDFELIVADDCSIDKTVEIARKYEQTDPRVRVYVNDSNLGDYPNRNRAAFYAKGKYLKYVDADDMIYPHGLEILVGTMEEFPEAGWGICTLKPDRSKIYPYLLSPHEAYLYHYLGPGIFHRAPLSSIVKTDVFTETGGFKPIRMAGDFEMWHRLAMKYPVVLIQEGLVWYRMHDDQEMRDHHQYRDVYKKITETYLNNPGVPLNGVELKRIRLEIRKRERKSKIKQVLSQWGRWL